MILPKSWRGSLFLLLALENIIDSAVFGWINFPIKK